MDRWKILDLSAGRKVGVMLQTPVNIDPMGDLARVGRFDAVFAPGNPATVGHPPFLALSEAILKGENFFRLAPFFHCFEKYSLQLPVLREPLGARRKSFFQVDLQLGSSTVSRIEIADGTGERVVDTAFIFSLFPNVTLKNDKENNLQVHFFSTAHLMGPQKPKMPWWTFGFGQDPASKIFPLPFAVEFIGAAPVLGLQVDAWREDQIDLTCRVHAGDVRYFNFFQPQFADPYGVKFEVDWQAGHVVTNLHRGGKGLTLRFPLQNRPMRTQTFPLLHPEHPVVYGNVLLLKFADHADVFLEWGSNVNLFCRLNNQGVVTQHRAEDGSFESVGSTIFPTSKVWASLRTAFVAMRASVTRGTPTDELLKGIWHAYAIE